MSKRSVSAILVLVVLVGGVFWLSSRRERVNEGSGSEPVPADGEGGPTLSASIGPTAGDDDTSRQEQDDGEAPTEALGPAQTEATADTPGAPATDEPTAVDVRLTPRRLDAGRGGPPDPGPTGSPALDQDYGRAFEAIDEEHAERMIAVRRERAVVLVNDLVTRMQEQAELAQAAGDTESADAFLQRKRRLLWRRSVLEGQLNEAAELANQDFAPEDQ